MVYLPAIENPVAVAAVAAGAAVAAVVAAALAAEGVASRIHHCVRDDPMIADIT